MSSSFPRVALVALAAMSLCGCRSSEGSTSSGSTGVNDCTAANATDLTAQAGVIINFANFAYTPSCIKVKANTVISFDGDFSMHPLRPGIDCTVDAANNPIPSLSTGTTQNVTFPNTGTYGFFCNNHCLSNGMKGAVIVQ